MFGAVNPKTGELIIYNEYYVPEKTLPYHAEKLKELTDEIPTGLLRFMVIDPATKNRMNDVINGRSIISHFQEYGLYFQPGNNNLDYGLAKVNSYIESGKLKVYKTCLNLIGELINYKYPELDMDSMHENRDEKPIKQNDHACFVGNTLIETKRGQIPIKDVVIGDYVQTRTSWKRVYDSALTKENATVYKIEFSNGNSLISTENHPVFVENKGFQRVDSLRYGDIIKVSPTWRDDSWRQKSSSGMDVNGESTHMKGISSVIGGTYTKKNGNITMVKFQKGIIFTIKTEMQKIMRLKTLNSLKRLNTYRSTQKTENTTSNTWKESDHSQKNGMVQRKVENGIKNMLKTQYSNTFLNMKHIFVKFARNRMRQMSIALGSALITVNQNGADVVELTMNKENANVAQENSQLINTVRQDTAPVHVVSIIAMGNADVYNISVEDAHEYYANGVLVHNCDGMRYLVARLPDDPNSLALESHAPPDRWGGIKPLETLDYEDNYSEIEGLDFLSYY